LQSGSQQYSLRWLAQVGHYFTAETPFGLAIQASAAQSQQCTESETKMAIPEREFYRAMHALRVWTREQSSLNHNVLQDAFGQLLEQAEVDAGALLDDTERELIAADRLTEAAHTLMSRRELSRMDAFRVVRHYADVIAWKKP
jgi:hypothetical protein